MLQIITY